MNSVRRQRRARAAWVVGFVALSVACADAADPGPPTLPVLPGLEGFGVRTPAGRGGAILRVTNLSDTGPGSLRAAVEAGGPRVIVFEVSGTIVLASRLEIEDPFVTIAGQTAPSPGITLRGAPLQIDTHDVLVQHLRIRVGDDTATLAAEALDGLQIYGSDVYNVVVDHLSISWAVDENLSASTAGNRRDITIRYTIVSEGLSHTPHPEGEHSKGMFFGDGTGNVAVVRSLLAHNRDRNPYYKAGSRGLFVNNVVYDWGAGAATDFDGDGVTPQFGSVVGNVYVGGLDTGTDLPIAVNGGVAPTSRFYVHDNALNRAAPPGDPWALVSNDAGTAIRTTTPPVWTSPLGVLPVGEVEAVVLANAGARPRDRDAVDARIVTQVATGSGVIIDRPADVGGWPVLEERQRPLTLPPDPHGDEDGDGYTNLEEWLHGLAAELEWP